MNIKLSSLLDAVDNFFEVEKHRLPNLVPMGIGIGICIYFSLDKEPHLFIGWFAFLISFTLFASYKFFSRKNTEPKRLTYKYIADFILSGFLLIAFGFLISQIRTRSVNTFMITENLKKPISFAATIDSCETTEKGLKFIVSNACRKYNDKENKLCKKFNKLHLIWIGEKARNAVLDYIPGSRVLFRASLSPIRPQAFPGAYDFKKQQYFKGISARGFIIRPPKIIQKYEQATLHVFIEQIRHSIDKTIEKYLPKNTAAIAKALTTGNTAGITKKIRTTFSNSGIAHILAISGLHIGIIGFFIFLIVRLLLCCITPISMFFDIKKIAAIASWLIVLFYLQISGCSVSSIRAFIMHTVVVIAILLDRTAFTMRSVAVAATIIMVYSPEVIMFPSFQMSFGAVIAIIAYVESDFTAPRFLKWLSEVVITTIIASIPTSIISISVFNQLTLNSILANIVSIPLMTFYVMPILMLALFLIPIGISQPIILLAGLGIDSLMKIAEKTAQLPGSFFVMPTPTNTVFAIVIASFLLFTLIHHKIRLIGLAGMFVGTVLYFIQPIADIFVAPNAKVIGIRAEDTTCFSHLGYFRSMTYSWSRSVGIEKRNNFNSKACSKYIAQIDKDTYEANIKGRKIIVTKTKNTKHSDDITFTLNEGINKFAEIIYLNEMKKISPKQIKRPWS